MPTIRILAVEDDAVQVRLLRHQVLLLDYELVGAATNAADAEALFLEKRPDLVLLDIHLKGQPDGIELALRLLAHRRVPLIFLTSDNLRSTYLRALEAGPFAFLTKPYDEAHFLRAMEMAVANFARAEGGDTANLPGGGALVPGALYVRENNRLLKVYYDEVLWMEADGSYVHLHTPTRKYTVKVSLSELEEKLPPYRFLRIRRNTLVQLASIDNIDLRTNTVWVRGNELAIGGTYREALLNALNRIG